jgi:thiol-disulfide isomerase/thioredoxin
VSVGNFWIRIVIGLLLWGIAAGGCAEAASRLRVHLFWAANCPHCAEARPFLAELADRYSRVDVVEYDIWGDRAAFGRLVKLAETQGQPLVSTPAILVGDRLWFGFSSALADDIEQEVLRCLAQGCADPLLPQAQTKAPLSAAESFELPLVGRLDPDTLSLPLLTIVIGLVDGFNPCAFFVLLFLLSLLTHARSRRLMLLVGGTFVFFSGLIYFLFMVAWLNLFLVAGSMRGITLVAGLVAVLVAAINIKDFFFFKYGVSLSIPERAKRGLFARMRTLVHASRIPAVLAGTLLLAVTANAYELLCTAGFPMVYTRVLTLHRLDPWQHYLFLVFYNLLYVLPLLTIVLVFTLTLGAKKLSERQGRILKLMSGVMMLLLGGLLLLRPELLNRPMVAGGLLLSALSASWLVVVIHDRFISGSDSGRL